MIKTVQRETRIIFVLVQIASSYRQAMGNTLEKGWETTVNDLNDKEINGDITLEYVEAVATKFAGSIDSNGDASVQHFQKLN